MSQVFISYSRSDRHYAQRLADRLKSENFDVWWDKDSLLPGDKWDPMLDDAISQSFALVVILTPNAIKSHWVTYEWTFASALQIRVIPLRVEDVEVKSIHRKFDQFNIYNCMELETSRVDKLVEFMRTINDPLTKIRSAPNKKIREEVVTELIGVARLNREMFEVLLAGLEDRDRDVREALCEVLGELGSSSAIEGLQVALRDDWFSVRSRAAEALGKIRDESAVQSLIRAMYDLEPIVRAEAAEALGLIGHADAISELVDALDDEAVSVKFRIVEALGRIKYTESLELAVKPLIRMLGDTSTFGNDVPLSEYAAQSLVFIGTTEALKAARDWRRRNPKPDIEL